MQFFGFLPRMLLGAYFGYLLYWTRNIWIPVFAHFVNNAIAVISMSDAKLKEQRIHYRRYFHTEFVALHNRGDRCVIFLCPLLSEIENYQIV